MGCYVEFRMRRKDWSDGKRVCVVETGLGVVGGGERARVPYR